MVFGIFSVRDHHKNDKRKGEKTCKNDSTGSEKHKIVFLAKIRHFFDSELIALHEKPDIK